MREIKFRGKCVNGKWVYGSYIETDIGAHFILSRNGEQKEVVKETVGQYIGLKDKRGKEFYDGDKYIIGLNTYAQSIDTMVWSVYRACFMGKIKNGKKYHFLKYMADECEIIGNIYEDTI